MASGNMNYHQPRLSFKNCSAYSFLLGVLSREVSFHTFSQYSAKNPGGLFEAHLLCPLTLLCPPQLGGKTVDLQTVDTVASPAPICLPTNRLPGPARVTSPCTVAWTLPPGRELVHRAPLVCFLSQECLLLPIIQCLKTVVSYILSSFF